MAATDESTVSAAIRYVCVDRTTAGKAVTTEFAIAEAFQRFFERDETLPISGIAIGVATKSAKETDRRRPSSNAWNFFGKPLGGGRKPGLQDGSDRGLVLDQE